LSLVVSTYILIGQVSILGVPVHDVTLHEACDLVEHMIVQGEVQQIATVNPEFIMAARRGPEFMYVLQHTALNVPDGIGILWAARRKQHPLRTRVPGIELMDKLCGVASIHRWRAYFLGAQPGVAERAAAALALKYPGLMIAGTYAGSPSPNEDAEIVARIRAAQPQLLFVAFGAPSQDMWLARNLPRIASQVHSPIGCVGMGVGGAFDFITGVQVRAPEWMRDAGLEWLYRLVRQPWRWKRQLNLVRFVAATMLESR
jgi:N-acetylglucosaminyldiphosphoundecaprenol N-acetyl-beta-D-mannosaminyltransferase